MMTPARFFLCVAVACAFIALVGFVFVDQSTWDNLLYILAGIAALPLGGVALGLALVFHFRRNRAQPPSSEEGGRSPLAPLGFGGGIVLTAVGLAGAIWFGKEEFGRVGLLFGGAAALVIGGALAVLTRLFGRKRSQQA